jgi:hypothetical protein
VSFVTEHDDRVNDAIRRVSFKPESNRIGKHRYPECTSFNAPYIGDDDDDMSVPGSSGRSTRL